MTLENLLLAALLLTLPPAVWRLISGPTDADRAAAADFVFFAFIAAIALLSLSTDNPALVDIVLVATLTGFLATVALARIVDRSRP
ncbi:multicomponent Na+:H+ antiporter subunit F [Microbacterium sp. AK009]|uniref:monovalent cation/H+ antiporter complex subunit F n=1 Tax=Microbacterium sp. AK009 TaxID=2723068 RepID=UPI0015C718F7|nr:monovalent cation/H+ antiporter complex subunit F [Microbacterium sp. AK009]NYF16587.1 multicomponent Na+:H+ antiporter subunit F [Microbacterium sp. AK009]